MEKYTKEYVLKKIENCKMLVETAISEAQRAVYQGYLDFWQGKDDATAAAEEKRIVEEELKKLHEAEARKKAAEEVEKAIELVEITPAQEMKYAEEFETINPNKHAYRYLDGEKLQTNAFVEFITLKLKPQ